MITKQLLTVEYRYKSLNKYKNDYNHIDKIITIGIYNTIEEAIEEGNKVLDVIAPYFDDNKETLNKVERFKLRGLWGHPRKLVTDLGVRHKTGVQMFAKITTLQYEDAKETLLNAIEQVKQYKTWAQNDN